MNTLTEKRTQIKERIAAILKEKGISQAELARRAEVPRSFITRIMDETADSPPTLSTIVKLETALESTIIEIPK